MAGAFYPPPPVFIGGAQPFAPPLGIPQSGEVPQAPPIRGPMVAATFALIVSSWVPGPQPAQGSPRFVYPPAAVVSQPPPSSQANLNLIRSLWTPPFTAAYLQGAGDIAPVLPVVVAPSQPIAVGSATFNAIRASWEPAFVLPPDGAQIAPLVPAPIVAPPLPVPNAALRLITDQWIDRSVTVITLAQIGAVSANPPIGPVTPNWAPYVTIRATWDPPFTDAYYQGAGDIAPIIASPAPPASQPAVSWSRFWTVRRAWDIDQPLPQVSSAIATQPVVNTAPLQQAAALQTIRNAWDAYTLPIQLFGLDGIAPLIAAPVVATQVPTNRVPYQTIRQAWEPAFQLPQTAAAIATQPIVNAPPTSSVAGLANLVALNQPPPYAIPRAGTVASWLPPAGAPSQPQPVSFALLYSVIRAWDPPVWWPLPGLTFHPVSGPAASAPPVPSQVTQRLILDSWTPGALPVQPFEELDGIAPLIAPVMPSGPPPASGTLLRLLLQSWDAVIQPQQDIGFIYPPLIVPSSPPPASIANLRTLIGAWDIWSYPPQRRPVVTPSGPVPQAPPVRTLLNFRIPLEQWVLKWDAQHSPPRNPVYVAPTLLGGPRYIVKRPTLRLFDVVPDLRTFSVAHRYPRTFQIARSARSFSVAHRYLRSFTVSALTMLRFDEIEPNELWPLTFDFTPDLLSGETLLTFAVAYATIAGTDPTPNAMANGSALLDPTSKKVIVPIRAPNFNGNDYQITVSTTTSNALKGPVLVGVLPVRL